jgi:hypothetical protein
MARKKKSVELAQADDPRADLHVFAGGPALGEMEAVRGQGQPGEDEIARRAYERFLARGGEHGHDQEDWYEAERSVRGEN